MLKRYVLMYLLLGFIFLVAEENGTTIKPISTFTSIDTNNIVTLLDKCYRDNRKSLRRQFEDNADMTMSLLDLDKSNRKEYIGFGPTYGDIYSMMDRTCDDYPEYDTLVSQMREEMDGMADEEQDELFVSVSRYIVIEFGNISEELDGRF